MSVKTSSGLLRWNLTRRRSSGSYAGGVAVKGLRMAATCCFWQRRHKEVAQRLKQWEDLKSLTETVATASVCQTPAPQCPPQYWFLKATRCWVQVRVRRSITQSEAVGDVRQRGCYNQLLSEV